MKFLSLLFLASTLWAGQSLTGGTGITAPLATQTGSTRIQFYVHDWNSPSDGSHILDVGAIGFASYYGGGTLIVYNTVDTGSITFNIPLSLFPNKRMYVRFHRDLTNLLHICEAWDETGVRQYYGSNSFTAVTNTGSGLVLAPSSSNGAVAFVQIFSTILPINSRPPTTVDTTNRIEEWKFDGNLNSAVGSNNGSGTGVTYGTTPDQLAYAIPKVNATAWSNWTSMRAGTTQTLTGSDSYSQADAANTVTCKWAVVTAPVMPRIVDPTVCDASINGIVFGTYKFRLTVVGASGLPATSDIDVGAVATDNNGIVINGNSAADTIFGPMIAFGKNPWGYNDDTALRGTKVRSAAHDLVSPPPHATFRAGTVSYQVGNTITRNGILTSDVTSSSTTITVNVGTTLDMSSLPTVVSFDFPGYGGEQVKICSYNSGTRTMTVCFDGRGYALSTPVAHTAGAKIIQYKVAGIGTAFLAEFCRAGTEVEGVLAYSTGTVAVTAGSTTVTGSGTSWVSGVGSTNVNSGMVIRVQGTYSSGTPFIFITTISSVTDTTHLVLSRAFPSGADTASGLTYQVVQQSRRNFAAEWTRPDSTVGLTSYQVSSCLSDTELYLQGGFEVYSATMSGARYSWWDSFWQSATGNGTPNFYDEVLADYALYFRSGYGPALTGARKIGDYWAKHPNLDEGWTTSFPRNIGVAGMVASATLDGRSANWYTIRKLAASSVAGALSASCDADVRENAYQLQWIAYAASFDPIDNGNSTDPNGGRTYWKAQLATAYTRDASCRQDDSFASGFYHNNGVTGDLTINNGSTAVTGAGFTAALCARTAGGGGTISTGGSTLTITSGTPVVNAAGKILITGTRSGGAYNAYFEFTGTGPVQISGNWIGDTGGVTWQTENDGNVRAWTPTNGFTFDDTNKGAVYGCTYNSSTSLTLNRVWAEGNTTTGRMSYNNLVGKGQQPFVLGIKTWQMDTAKRATTGALSTNYQALAVAAANWILNTGFDTQTGGLYYGRKFPMCEPPLTAPNANWSYATYNCSYGTANTSKEAAQALLGEAQNALRVAYEAAPSPALKTKGDTYYAGLWGHPTYTTGGVQTSNLSPFLVNYTSTAALNIGKWYGFQFGVGMAHQWPAVRLGGVAAKTTTTKSIKARLADFSAATDIVVDFLAADGTVTTSSACTSAACTFSADDRQNYLYRVRYRNAGGGTIATGEYVPVR